MKLEQLKEIFNQSYSEYNDYMSKNETDYWEHYGFISRRMQIESLIRTLNDDFKFDKIVTLETGASQNRRDAIFGFFLGLATVKTGGKMISVDINKELVDRSYELFKSNIPDLDYTVFESDSIQFLTNLDEIPNLVHLDSWDLDLKNPFPCALHGWREFAAIESKMLPGSIVIIDDNYIAGTWVDWHYPDGTIEKINNVYPMIGKGVNVYHYALNGDSNWKLIGNHYDVYNNIKIIVQKKP